MCRCTSYIIASEEMRLIGQPVTHKATTELLRLYF
jgi:hypothetical protein